MKRVFDVVLSLFLLLILSPLMLVLGLLVKVRYGSAIYKQKRLGKYGKEFTLYKFKTMKGEEEVPMLEDNERTTRFGNWLRGGLDELPQLFNIVKGDMSFVGPRPERKFFHDIFVEGLKDWDIRLSVAQGITGLAQINSASSLEPVKKLKYDLEYIQNQSFKQDMKILGKTAKNLLGKYLKISRSRK